MPTAVERLASLLRNTLDLDIVDSPFAQRAFAALDPEIDPAAAALNGATTPRAFATAERQYGHVFEAMGFGAAVLGSELQRDAFAFNAIGDILFSGADIFGGGGGSGRVAEVWGGGGGSGRVADIFGGGGGSGAQADLATLDTHLFNAGGDLEVFGADFARLGKVSTHEALVTAEGRLSPDLRQLQTDFVTLDRDVTKFAGDLVKEWGGGSGFTADQAGLLRVLSQFHDEFGKITESFGTLADIYGGGGGSGTTAEVWGGGGGSGFGALHEGFVALDGSLKGLGAPLAGLLLPAVHTTTGA